MLVSFRSCTPRDYRVLLGFVREFYRSDRIRFSAAATGPALRKLLRDDSLGKAFLLEAGKKPVGYAILTYNFDLEYGGMEGMLTDLFVVKKCRGEGIGSLALYEIEDFCRDCGIDALELQVRRRNQAAQKFYRQAGYKFLERVVMIRDIPPAKPAGIARRKHA
jgi:ribosomal protein S18 acetylase RimI-like enzyme